jgi:hypothetical protein
MARENLCSKGMDADSSTALTHEDGIVKRSSQTKSAKNRFRAEP